MNNGFGAQLKEWRGIRRLSQLDLALHANISARHLSFLETGRAKPSREMVLLLGEALQAPRPVCNQMLTAAGFAHCFAARSEADVDTAPLYDAMDWMLKRHDPYPAFALDRHWKLLKMNATAQLLVSGAGLDLGDSLLEALLHNETMRSTLVNLEEIENHTLQRLRTELAHLGQDPVLEAAIKSLQARQKVGSVTTTPAAMIPAHYRFGDHVLSFFSTLSQFGGTDDITLAEIKIEMLFPANDVTKAFLTG